MNILKLGDSRIINAKALLQHIGCPCCGETKRSIEYGENWMNFGISKSVAPRKYKTGFFRKKTWQIDTFHCLTCGAIWEGEPYETNSVR